MEMSKQAIYAGLLGQLDLKLNLFCRSFKLHERYLSSLDTATSAQIAQVSRDAGCFWMFLDVSGCFMNPCMSPALPCLTRPTAPRNSSMPGTEVEFCSASGHSMPRPTRHAAPDAPVPLISMAKNFTATSSPCTESGIWGPVFRCYSLN